MRYCLNPDCSQRRNPDTVADCQTCGTPLIIQGKYSLARPLRSLASSPRLEIFELRGGDRPKVLKLLKDRTPSLVRLFNQEAQVLGQLDHPGIPQVETQDAFEFRHPNCPRTLRGVVMEKIEGQNLADWLTQHGPIPESIAIEWLGQIANILVQVHQQSFFHRDIKPSNIMRRPNGQLALIDFGTAREITETVISGGNVTIVFSYGYTAPEQISGSAEQRSDFYALGRTFVNLLTGQHPENLPKHPQTGQLFWRNQAPNVSESLADLIDHLMQPEVADRPANATEILDRLALIEARQTATSRGWLRWGVPTLALGIGAAIAALILVTPESAPARCARPRTDVTDMVFHPSDDVLITVGSDRTLRLVDGADFDQQLACLVKPEELTLVAVSPDGQTLAFAGYGGLLGQAPLSVDDDSGTPTLRRGEVSQLNAGEGEDTAAPPLPNTVIVNLAFSPSGNHLVSTTAAGLVQVWTVEDSPALVTQYAVGSYPLTVSFSPEGDQLAIASSHNPVTLWNWQEDGDAEAAIQTLPVDNVTTAVFSPTNNDYLALGSGSGIIQVWQVSNQTELAQLAQTEQRRSRVLSLDFSADGDYVMARNLGGTSQTWAWESEQDSRTTFGDSLTTVLHDSHPLMVTASLPSRANYVRITASNLAEFQEPSSRQSRLSNLAAVAFKPSEDGIVVAIASLHGQLEQIEFD